MSSNATTVFPDFINNKTETLTHFCKWILYEEIANSRYFSFKSCLKFHSNFK